MKRHGTFHGGISIRVALLALIATVLIASLVPAGIALDRRLASSLEERARADLAVAPRILMDRNQARGDVLAMHARELAGGRELQDVLAAGDQAAALRIARTARGNDAENVVLVTADGRVLTGPPLDRTLVDSARGLPLGAIIAVGGGLRRLSLVPIRRGETFVGAAGFVAPVDASEAGTLAGLTRARVLILGPDAMLVASTADEMVTAGLVGPGREWRTDSTVHEVRIGGNRWIVVAAPIGRVATVVFARNLDEELAVLPSLRRVAATIGLAALLISLILGAIVAVRFGEPVRMLADAADRLARGDVGAPLAVSRVRELGRVSRAFDEMRRTLAARLDELQAANRDLADRQQRLAALQGELIRRDRVAATGQLVAQLAHEIRNPVANVRNLLELLRRRFADDAEGRQLAELAIDELLRMHDLAEQMLTLHRPRESTVQSCDAAAVAREVAALTAAGAAHDDVAIRVTGVAELSAAIPADPLKQVLINLVQNAREAVGERGDVTIDVQAVGPLTVIEVRDGGPGIAPEILPRVFDPFFTTKGDMQGVGLGLFVAEGLVRAAGGRIAAGNRPGGSGAWFRVELPTHGSPPAAPSSMARESAVSERA